MPVEYAGCMSGTDALELFDPSLRRDQAYFDNLMPKDSSPNGLDYVPMTDYSVGRQAAVQVGGAAVPEPATVLAFALGGAVFLKRLRKRKV